MEGPKNRDGRIKSTLANRTTRDPIPRETSIQSKSTPRFGAKPTSARVDPMRPRAETHTRRVGHPHLPCGRRRLPGPMQS